MLLNLLLELLSYTVLLCGDSMFLDLLVELLHYTVVLCGVTML